MRNHRFTLLLVIWMCPLPPTLHAADDGFQSLFDGRTLDNWSAPNMSYWSVRDGAITARSTQTNPCTKNQFLVWQGGNLSNFELKLSFRIQGPEVANAGIQIRSAIMPDGHAVGYQADIARDASIIGTLYDEHTGRGLLAGQGQRVVIDEDGKRTSEPVGDADRLKQVVKLNGWNDYHIVARGHHLTLSINDQVMCEVLDWQRDHFDASGKLALQLHSGPPTTVQFRNIRLKPIAEVDFQLEPGYVRLDNGRDLEGWKGDLTGWSVAGGAIHLEAATAKGNIYHGTTHSRNCIIRLQFRATRGADSGVFIHGKQLQVRDYPNAGPAQYAKPCKPAGEWNDLEWDIKDGVAAVRLNGEIIESAWPIGMNAAQGIGLQKESGNFDFRYVRIKEKSLIEFKERPGMLEILVGNRPFATYVYSDPNITRPYFSHLRTPGGVQVTRNHPPVEGTDATDHATFHPGLWLAFGDISGNDYWRLRARVKHDRFASNPQAVGGRGSFAVLNRYQGADDAKTVCVETCRYTIIARPGGSLILWDSEFRSEDGEFVFGDQEEMGLGVRVATPLTVTAGGEISDADGHRNEKQVRGHPSDWCDYGGVIGGQRVGVTLMPHPDNFRKCWYHARDYGFVAANPFGRKALTNGEASQVLVKRGESLRLRFGVLIHSAPADQPLDLKEAYRDYLQQAGK